MKLNVVQGFAAAVIAASLATGCSHQRAGALVWHVSRAPKVRLSVVQGCLSSFSPYEDVVNTFSGPPLVPAKPRAGLVCWFNGTNLPNPGALGRQVRLGSTGAGTLANAIRALSLKPPAVPPPACPAAFGTVATIAFSYSSRKDVGLWVSASGCQSLDNGRLGSFEEGNPSFYVGFEGAMNQLAPEFSAPPSAQP